MKQRIGKRAAVLAAVLLGLTVPAGHGQVYCTPGYGLGVRVWTYGAQIPHDLTTGWVSQLSCSAGGNNSSWCHFTQGIEVLALSASGSGYMPASFLDGSGTNSYGAMTGAVMCGKSAQGQLYNDWGVCLDAPPLSYQLMVIWRIKASNGQPFATTTSFISL